MNNKLIEAKNISKVFKIGGLIWGTKLIAVDNVSFSMDGGKPSILSIVGESGSGKTTLARIILKLIEPTRGRILIEGKNIFDSKNKFNTFKFRRSVQPIFQNPSEAFSIRKKASTYLYETAINFGIAKKGKRATNIISEILTSVGLSFEYVANKLPNQFSGGELQRISIARALILKPKLMIVDEPVSMIDASLKMNIVNLFLKLKEEYKISFIYITHDLSIAYYISDFVAIMYRGNVVEYGPSNMVLTEPLHPYTELLISSVPRINEKWKEDIKLPGVETKEFAAKGCKFAIRCPYCKDICKHLRPPVVKISENRIIKCFKYADKKKREQKG